MRSWTVRSTAGIVAVAAVAGLAQASGVTHGVLSTAAADVDRLVGDDQLTSADVYVLGAVLLLLARGLAMHRRLAWRALLGLTCVAALTPPHRPVRLAFLAASTVALLGVRAECAVPVDPRRLRAAGQAALGGLAIVVLHGVWLLTVDGSGARESAMGAVPLDAGPGDTPAAGLLVSFVAVSLLALAFALASAAAPPPGDEASRRWVLALADHPDADSLAPFATRTDKAYVFSPDCRAVIGYRVLFGVAVAAGNPVGSAASAPAAVAAFLAMCAERGWRPAVLGAGPASAAVWRAAGVRRGLVIGDEAVLDVATFSLGSRSMRNLRQAVRRSMNAGVGVTVGPLDEPLARRLAPVLADWLGGRAERGFAMNLDRMLVPRDDALFAVAYDGDGVPQAFARFLRCGDGGTLTLDVAPRRRGALNGVVERMIVEVVRYAYADGVREVSLNFAGMRGVFVATTPAARLAGGLLRLFDRWIELRPLYRFTAKFHPVWRPRSLLLRSWWEVVPVGAAALVAEFGRTGRGPEAVPELAEQPAAA